MIEVASDRTRQAVSRVTYAAEGWGVGELWLEGDRLVEHTLPAPSNNLSRGAEGALASRMRSYFRGGRVSFDDVELDLDGCSPFQRALTDALRAVPYGSVVTYGELAALAGRPGAQRAAGTFCARNRFPLIVPCHRVVGASGIGGYGLLGTEYKRRLLALERVSL